MPEPKYSVSETDRWIAILHESIGTLASPEMGTMVLDRIASAVRVVKRAREVYRVAAEVPWVAGQVNPVRLAEAEMKSALEEWED